MSDCVISGAKKLSLYEEVLRQVRYVNSEPQELNSRTFVLTCTELNGRFVSNRLETTVRLPVCVLYRYTVGECSRLCLRNLLDGDRLTSILIVLRRFSIFTETLMSFYDVCLLLGN